MGSALCVCFSVRPNTQCGTRLGQRRHCLFHHNQDGIKAYRHTHLYEKEWDVYFRLAERDVVSVGRFTVPQMLHHSPELKCIEMTIVSPPFILDFAGAYLDAKPPFNEKVWEEWDIEKLEQFEDRWPEVRSALAVFRRHGIYLNDVKPGNVTFPD